MLGQRSTAWFFSMNGAIAPSPGSTVLLDQSTSPNQATDFGQPGIEPTGSL